MVPAEPVATSRRMPRWCSTWSCSTSAHPEIPLTRIASIPLAGDAVALMRGLDRINGIACKQAPTYNKGPGTPQSGRSPLAGDALAPAIPDSRFPNPEFRLPTPDSRQSKELNLPGRLPRVPAGG